MSPTAWTDTLPRVVRQTVGALIARDGAALRRNLRRTLGRLPVVCDLWGPFPELRAAAVEALLMSALIVAGACCIVGLVFAPHVLYMLAGGMP